MAHRHVLAILVIAVFVNLRVNADVIVPENVLRFGKFFPGKFTDTPLAVVFVNGDFDGRQLAAEFVKCFGDDALGDDSCDLFGGRVDDRKDDTVFVGEDPTPLAKCCCRFLIIAGDEDLGVVARQDHVVVQGCGFFENCIAECDEVDDVAVRIERAFDANTDSIVMAVDALANIAGEGDEVGGGEDELLFADVDGKGGSVG